jgi:hypothetical protein
MARLSELVAGAFAAQQEKIVGLESTVKALTPCMAVSCHHTKAAHCNPGGAAGHAGSRAAHYTGQSEVFV